MDKPVENIIAKVLSGEATSDEQKFIEEWKKENNVQYKEFEHAYSANIFDTKEFSHSIFKKKISYLNSSPKNNFLTQNNLLFKIAAVFMGLAIISSLYFYNKSLSVTISNNSDELSQIILPDGSQITLADNATINYYKGWFNIFNRKVKLTGKAYFEIVKDEGRKFVVNTSKLDVTVLGTKFTVNELSSKTQFVLTEGKVKLDGNAIDKSLIISNSGSQIIVNDNEILIDDIVDQRLYASWLNNKIHFNNCTVLQVIDMLYNSYDIEVELDNPELQNKKLFGSAPSDDPELILDALSYILNTELVTGKPRK